ncbi:aspA [Gossypium arboreum]|uniref:AspA n=1 Tax=Gossypium arboreum TaxID=29729 RepID=A0A0B0NXF3_GOSAR|nr:aspA [Gossypium arboreum]
MPRRILRDLSIIQNPSNLEETNSDQQTAIGSSNVLNIVDEPARFALEVSVNYVKKALAKKLRDHKITLKKEYFKKNISLEEKLRNVPPGMLRYQWENADRFWNSKKIRELLSGRKVRLIQLFDIAHRKKDRSPMTTEAVKIMEKLNDKRVEFESMTSSDSYVNLDDIDNKIITEVLDPERYGRVRFQGSFVTSAQYFRSSSQQYMPSANQAQAEV